ncbi:MAG: cellulose binding domain-containing protein, partial [Methylococcales bacterium]|nr:cellulose binding domain-containing protein [Methylococcales bacterium]
ALNNTPPTPTPTPTPTPPTAACSDNIDNDNDGLVDYPNDLGCDSATDNDEHNIITAPLDVKVSISSEWESGYCANVIVKNPSSTRVNWTVNFKTDGQINNIWNASYTQVGQQVTAEGLSWNKTISAGETRNFGFCANKQISAPVMACSDQIDNDGDGFTDYPNDPGCDSATDNDESNAVTPVNVSVKIQSDWGTGYCAKVIVKNMSSSNVDWTVNFTIDGQVNNLWNASYTQVGQQVTAEGLSWNNFITANGKRDFGFCAQR